MKWKFDIDTNPHMIFAVYVIILCLILLFAMGYVQFDYWKTKAVCEDLGFDVEMRETIRTHVCFITTGYNKQTGETDKCYMDPDFGKTATDWCGE